MVTSKVNDLHYANATVKVELVNDEGWSWTFHTQAGRAWVCCTVRRDYQYMWSEVMRAPEARAKYAQKLQEGFRRNK